MEKINITWDEVFNRLRPLDVSSNIVYGVPNGGMIASAFLKKAKVTHKPQNATHILDDIEDSGATRRDYESTYKGIFYPLFKNNNDWLVFPWERDHPSDHNIEFNIIRQLQYIGEDVKRQGIFETPKRVVKSWKEIYSGYTIDVNSLFKVFDGPEQYDQMIVCKDIELYSMCEHHMLPFYGKAHVAYIPQGNKVIGVSKLARLVEAYSRRLQIQERICKEVTAKLMEKLNPLGAACVIEAKHFCMVMRGVNKQHSKMTTSSMEGVFRNIEVKEEFLNFIK